MLVFGGGSKLELKRHDIVPLVRDAVNRNDWSEAGAHPDIRVLGGDGFVVRIDEFKAGQVFDNILKNACEAILAKGRGRTMVLIEDDGGSVLVRFVDTGVGIRNEDLAKIGKPLFTTKPNGTGFGLAISRKIMEAHGGTLVVESRYGYYTRVSLAFPKETPRVEEAG
jgi:signal transduction histidine kinase